MRHKQATHDIDKESESETLGLDEAAKLIAKRAGYDIGAFADEYTRQRLNRHLLDSQHQTSTPFSSHRKIGQLSRQDVISALSLNVTTMFRDPTFYSILRQQVLPSLSRRKHLLIWEIGCSTGEESYSLAITLNETGWANRYAIIATDFDSSAIEKARRGRYDIRKAGTFTRNYYTAEGQSTFSNYYSATSRYLDLDPLLRRYIFFREADVTKDRFNFRPDLIICRNVMIYFSRSQQLKTFNLLSRSLKEGGFLCIGSKEPIPTHSLEFQMREIAHGGRVFAVQRGRGTAPRL